MTNYTKYGLLLFIISIVLGIVSILFLLITKSQFNLSFGGLIALIAIILIGVGRKEFGERHRKFVIIGIILFIVQIVVGFILVLMTIMVAVSSRDISLIKNIFWIIPLITIISGITYVFFLNELENKTGRYILFAAVALTIIISIYISIEGYAITEEWGNKLNARFNEGSNFTDFSSTIGEDLVQELMQKISYISAFVIIGNILFIFAFYIPYQRITSGELKPALPSHLKRCMSCGRPVPSDSVVCPYCGKQFESFLK
jgi:hypothetical protein